MLKSLTAQNVSTDIHFRLASIFWYLDRNFITISFYHGLLIEIVCQSEANAMLILQISLGAISFRGIILALIGANRVAMRTWIGG